MPAVTLVFVHGWSVTNLNTYGNLPARLRAEGKQRGVDIQVEEIFLGRYISFHDEVRVPDISRAFKTAIIDQLSHITSKGNRFICITHSTGGPVIRDWWNRYYKDKRGKCPMSHLIMLAPANFGSALAQLGKGVLSRLKSWWNGVEPGQGVLDFLELGSAETWELNKEWIQSDGSHIGPAGIFPFVLIGQTIDRKLYDVLNSYTGETGSDGVIRVASANMEGRYIKLVQPVPTKNEKGKLVTEELKVSESKMAPVTALRVIHDKSHGGNKKGIQLSVEEKDPESMETINAIFECIRIKTKKEYDDLCKKFRDETAAVQRDEHIEREDRFLLADRFFIHDRYTMITIRVRDNEGYPITDYDFVLTAGENDDPNHLPEGFFIDRQRNKKNKETVTYYINYDIMQGLEKPEDIVRNNKGEIIRGNIVGIDRLGLILTPRPDDGFVRYIGCKYTANKKLFNWALNPNSTTMIDIVLQRVVDKEVFRLEDLVPSKNFGGIKPSNEIAE